MPSKAEVERVLDDSLVALVLSPDGRILADRSPPPSAVIVKVVFLVDDGDDKLD
jgi:hypothetical protein